LKFSAAGWGGHNCALIEVIRILRRPTEVGIRSFW
jgi:hypothetical protein